MDRLSSVLRITDTDHVETPGQSEPPTRREFLGEFLVIGGTHKEETLEILSESVKVVLEESVRVFGSEGRRGVGVEQGQNVSAGITESDLLEIDQQSFIGDPFFAGILK